MHYSKSFYQIRSNDYIYNKLLEEKETIGYYNLPFQDTSYIQEFTAKNNKTQIVVIGIGGSSLGTKAVYDFVKGKQPLTKELIFLESTDPIDINSKINKLDFNDTLFILISKSGTTIETISIFQHISTLTTITNQNCIIISESKTGLAKYAISNNLPFFKIPKNVGGRFSVFSTVGLVPLSLVGIDINNMLKGAAKVHDSFFNKEQTYERLMEKARFFIENKTKFNINIIFSYSSSLESFNKWYIQLWAESLGKININGTRQGLTPIGLIGPTDQHSFLQLIIDGVRDKTVTFVKIGDFQEKTIIPPTQTLSISSPAQDVSFARLINMQADATIGAINEQSDIPYDTITIDKADEYNLAEIIYSYELLVSIMGVFLQINTYDQPGVENGKKILSGMLND